MYAQYLDSKIKKYIYISEETVNCFNNVNCFTLFTFAIEKNSMHANKHTHMITQLFKISITVLKFFA